MNRNAAIIAVLLTLLGCVGAYFYLATHVDKIWRAEVSRENLYGDKKMLGAKRLLEKHQQKVIEAETMHDALRTGIPNGTLFITSNQGFLLPAQVKQVNDWVRRGNTLIVLPANSQYEALRRKAEAAADKDEKDEKTDAEKKKARDLESEEKKYKRNLETEDGEEEDAGVPSKLGKEGKNAPSTKGKPAPAPEEDRDISAKPSPLSKQAGGDAEQGAPDDAENASSKPNEDDKDADAVKPSAREDAAEEAEDKSSNPERKLELDPFGRAVDVKRGYRYTYGSCVREGKTECAPLTLKVPKLGYPLRIAANYVVLHGFGKPDQLVLADSEGEAIRIYAEGQGQIVVLGDNFFDNFELPRYDHAELLLYLTQLSGAGKNTLFIKNLDFLPWYEALWDNGKWALISLAVALMLSLWMGMRRFGPLLPEMVQERRAMIEHIDASGRWLWHLPGGPELLLTAARANTNLILKRRIAEWGRLSPQEQVQRLLKDGNFTEQKLWQALYEKPLAQAVQFTTQVQTLQLLRKKYERK